MNRGQETAKDRPQNCSIGVSGSRSVGFSSHHCSALVLKTKFPWIHFGDHLHTVAHVFQRV